MHSLKLARQRERSLFRVFEINDFNVLFESTFAEIGAVGGFISKVEFISENAAALGEVEEVI